MCKKGNDDKRNRPKPDLSSAYLTSAWLCSSPFQLSLFTLHPIEISCGSRCSAQQRRSYSHNRPRRFSGVAPHFCHIRALNEGMIRTTSTKSVYKQFEFKSLRNIARTFGTSSHYCKNVGRAYHQTVACAADLLGPWTWADFWTSPKVRLATWDSSFRLRADARLCSSIRVVNRHLLIKLQHHSEIHRSIE